MLLGAVLVVLAGLPIFFILFNHGSEKTVDRNKIHQHFSNCINEICNPAVHKAMSIRIKCYVEIARSLDIDPICRNAAAIEIARVRKIFRDVPPPDSNADDTQSEEIRWEKLPY